MLGQSDWTDVRRLLPVVKFDINNVIKATDVLQNAGNISRQHGLILFS